LAFLTVPSCKSAVPRDEKLIARIQSEPALAFIECQAYNKAQAKESKDPRGCDPLEKTAADYYKVKISKMQFDLDKEIFDYCIKLDAAKRKLFSYCQVKTSF